MHEFCSQTHSVFRLFSYLARHLNPISRTIYQIPIPESSLRKYSSTRRGVLLSSLRECSSTSRKVLQYSLIKYSSTSYKVLVYSLIEYRSTSREVLQPLSLPECSRHVFSSPTKSIDRVARTKLIQTQSVNSISIRFAFERHSKAVRTAFERKALPPVRRRTCGTSTKKGLRLSWHSPFH